MPLLLLILTRSLLSVTYEFIPPPKPGFYGVKVLENKALEYVELERHEGKQLGDDPVTAWDFRLVTGSTAISTVRDQGSCGGCWAFSSSDVAGAALYLNTPPGHVNKVFSPQYQINCRAKATYQGTEAQQLGCVGGFSVIAFVDILANGHCEEECLPWTGDPGNRSTCPLKCKNNGPTNNTDINLVKFPSSEFSFYYAYHASLQELKNLVTTSGPCVAEMTVYSDLFSYRSGVYTTNKLEDMGGHAVVVYGFGREDGTDYWLIKNSWGTQFGDNGYFKIRMGTNESGIERVFYSLVDRRTLGNYNIPLPAEPTDPVKPTQPVIGCDSVAVEADCTSKSSEGCKWYVPNVSGHEGEYAPFCDDAVVACSRFEPLFCNTSVLWDLPNCVVVGGKCVEAGTTVVEADCVKLLSQSDCAAAENCRWYHNDVDKDDFCDIANVNCSMFGTRDYCGIAFYWELGCVWDEDESGNAPACNHDTEESCVADWGCQWTQATTRDPWECKYEGECTAALDCSPFATKELCEEQLGCDWDTEGIVSTISSFLDLDLGGSCVPSSSSLRLSVLTPVLVVAMLLLSLL